MVRNTKQRQGLTLIELVVVLVVLVALAGIIVPMLPSMLGRAHTSSGATNIAEINKFVQIHEQFNQSYPNYLDNLAGTAAPIDYLPGGTAGGAISVDALSTEEADALIAAGITQLAPLHPTKAALLAAGGSPTFNPYTSAALQTVSDTLNVSFASEAAVEKSIVKDFPTNSSGDRYVILGLGKQSSMIGKTMADAPTHFGENEQGNASNVYGRYGLVFRVARGNGTATPTTMERAIFVGAVGIHDDGIEGADGHLAEYYNLTKSQ